MKTDCKSFSENSQHGNVVFIKTEPAMSKTSLNVLAGVIQLNLW